MEKANLKKKVREASRKDSFVPRTRPMRANIKKRVDGSCNDKINLIGLYERELLHIQNDRQWDDNLCRSYDRAMHGEFGKVFEPYPLEDLTEQDYITLWGRYIDSKPSKTERQRAYTMIRYLADLAYKLKESDVIFWGDINEEIRLSNEMKNKDNIARKGEALGLRIGRSLSPQAEIRLLISALGRIAEEGAFLAGILIFLLGLRTSEACGLRFCDIIKVRPGYWAAKRYMLMEAAGGEIAMGSKTNNGYRLVPLPRFLAALILNRRDALKAQYPHENVDAWTIACSGQNYANSADQGLVNRVMNELYRETNCDEDLMRMALRDFRTDSEIRSECEQSLIAYLGRHQMITEMVAIGMPERYIFALAGHAQMDPDADIADMSNPDVFIKVSDYLNRRPVIWALDHSAHTDYITFTGKQKLSNQIDGDIEMVWNGDDGQMFILAVQAQDPMNEVLCEFGEDVSIVEEFILPPLNLDASKTVSITPYLRRIAQETIEIITEGKTGGQDKLSDSLSFQPEAEKDAFCFTAVEVGPERYEALPTEQAVVVRKQRTNPLPEQNTEEFKAIASHSNLYVLDNLGTVLRLEGDSLKVWNRNTKGKKVFGSANVKRIYSYEPTHFNFALTPDGRIYPIPPQPRLDSILKRSENAQLADAFRSEAILISWNDHVEKQRLICLTNTGSVVSYEADALRKIRPGGRQLVSIGCYQERIVSACFCQEGEDVLIVSAKGKVLRLASPKLVTRKTLGSSPVVGLKLADGDKAVSCLPYGTGDFLFAKSDGMVAAIHVDMMPHDRGSGGSMLILGSEVVAAINQCDLVALLDDAGYFGLYDCVDFAARKGRTKGIAVKKMSRENRLLAVCGIQADVRKAKIAAVETATESRQLT